MHKGPLSPPISPKPPQTCLKPPNPPDLTPRAPQNREEQNSPFQSLWRLRQHPLYLMAFVQHVALQFDCCPLVMGTLGTLWGHGDNGGVTGGHGDPPGTRCT